MPNPKSAPLHERVQQVLESHGHLLPQLVARTVRSIPHSEGAWKFQTWEHPVTVGDFDTRIDCVLRYGHTKQYLAIECKRVDPNYTMAWAFFDARHVASGHRDEERFYGETTRISTHGCYPIPGFVHIDGDYGNLALVVPWDQDKDKKQNEDNKGADGACFQVCNGVAGLVAHFFRRCVEGGADTQGDYVVTPMIVTTARLVVSGVDISDADAQDGKLVNPIREVKDVPWVFYQHHRTPLLNKNPAREDLGTTLKDNHIRTVPIVRATHLREFLAFFTTDLLKFEKIPSGH